MENHISIATYCVVSGKIYFLRNIRDFLGLYYLTILKVTVGLRHCLQGRRLQVYQNNPEKFHENCLKNVGLRF